jgi:hypothetical protein
MRNDFAGQSHQIAARTVAALVAGDGQAQEDVVKQFAAGAVCGSAA